MFTRLIVVASISIAAGLAQDIAGDWQGTINRPAGALRLALHIARSGSNFSATLDSVDQGIAGIPVDGIALAGSKLSFRLPAFQASYEGTVDAAASAIDGTLSGGAGDVALVFRRGAIAKVQHKPAKPSDIDGDWTGRLEDQDYVFHIANTEDGLIVAMDLASQHIRGAEASSVKRSDSSIAMEWKAFGSRFEGKIAPDHSTIEGAVTQAGNTIPFTLTRM